MAEQQDNHALTEFISNLYQTGMSSENVLHLGYEFAIALLYADGVTCEPEYMRQASAMLARAVKARNELLALKETR